MPPSVAEATDAQQLSRNALHLYDLLNEYGPLAPSVLYEGAQQILGLSIPESQQAFIELETGGHIANGNGEFRAVGQPAEAPTESPADQADQAARPPGRPYVVEWRDAMADSGLDRTAKLAAFALSTYANASGAAWPSVKSIALRGSISERTAGKAVDRLEREHWLAVKRSRGKGSHRYQLTIPNTEPPSAFSSANTERRTANTEPRSDEVVPQQELNHLELRRKDKWGQEKVRNFPTSNTAPTVALSSNRTL